MSDLISLQTAVAPLSSHAPARLTRAEKRNLALASLGSMLEFYEFMVFGFFATLIGKLFFPAALPDAVKTLQAFALYALGFLLRPVAGTIIGHLGDRFGRKKMFMFTVFMMAVPTTAIGLMPTYARIGIAAPLILLMLRLMQGVAIAGEFAGASVFVIEHTSRRHAATASGFMLGASYIGFFLGAGSGALLANFMSEASLEAWGWRIPFLIGGIFGLVAVYLRRGLDETPLFLEIERLKGEARPLSPRMMVKSYGHQIVYDSLLSTYLGMMIIILYFYMPAFLQTQYGFDRAVVFNANSAALFLLAVLCPVWGCVADRWGYGMVLGVGALGVAAGLSAFLYNLDAIAAAPHSLIVWWLGLSVFMSTAAVIPAISALVFPTQLRFTGFGLAYNIGILASAVAPTLMSWAVLSWGGSAIIFCVAAVGALGVILAIWTPRFALFPR
jgi:MFS family permease